MFKAIVLILCQENTPMKKTFFLFIALLFAEITNAQNYQPIERENAWFTLQKNYEDILPGLAIGFTSPIITVFDTSYVGGTFIYTIDTIYQAADTIWVPDPGFYLYIPADTIYDTTNITNIGGSMIISGGDTIGGPTTGWDPSWEVKYHGTSTDQGMTFMQDTVSCTTAGVPIELDSLVVPLYVYIQETEDYRIEMDTIANYSYTTSIIDSALNFSVGLDTADYVVHLDTGAYSNRFYMQFIRRYPKINRTENITVTAMSTSNSLGVVKNELPSHLLKWNSYQQTISIQKQSLESGYLEIYDLNGRLVIKKQIFHSLVNNPLNLYKSGTYIIRYMEEDKAVVRKISFMKK